MISTPKIPIGAREHRVTVYVNTPSQSASGQVTNTATEYGKFWAKVETLSGRELEYARHTVATATDRLTLDYSATAVGITNDMWVLHRGRTLQIESNGDTDDRHDEVVLLCTEVADR